MEITSDAERFIVSEDNLRIRCQRVINFLLVWLDSKRDCKQFCYLFNMITVMTNLLDKLRTGKPSCACIFSLKTSTHIHSRPPVDMTEIVFQIYVCVLECICFFMLQ